MFPLAHEMKEGKTILQTFQQRALKLKGKLFFYNFNKFKISFQSELDVLPNNINFEIFLV